MAYKKPEVVAKSEAKQSFVGGCPEKRMADSHCNPSSNRITTIACLNFAEAV